VVGRPPGPPNKPQSGPSALEGIYDHRAASQSSVSQTLTQVRITSITTETAEVTNHALSYLKPCPSRCTQPSVTSNSKSSVKPSPKLPKYTFPPTLNPPTPIPPFPSSNSLSANLELPRPLRLLLLHLLPLPPLHPSFHDPNRVPCLRKPKNQHLNLGLRFRG